jgi:hypothetical protein
MQTTATTSLHAMATGPGGLPGQIWNLPALPPAHGRVSNFDNPDSRRTELIIMNSLFLSATLIAVAIRFIARRSSKDKFGWDVGK